MNSHAHERLGKSFIVAFDGDVCPHCELLKEYSELTRDHVPSRPELGQIWEPKKVAEGVDAKEKRLTIHATVTDRGGTSCSFEEEVGANFKWPYLRTHYRYVGMKAGQTQTTGSQAETINKLLDDLAKTPEQIEKELFGGPPKEPEVGQVWATRSSMPPGEQITIIGYDCPRVKYRNEWGEGSMHWDRLLHLYACVSRPAPTETEV